MLVLLSPYGQFLLHHWGYDDTASLGDEADIVIIRRGGRGVKEENGEEEKKE